MVRILTRFRWAPWALAAIVVVGVAGVTLFWPRGGDRYLPPTRARVYAATQACLVTGPTGLSDPQTAPVWAGMEDASAATKIKVSYLAVSGPATSANALPYVASMLQRRCDLVVAVGKPEVAAAQQTAAGQLKVRFLLVGDGSGTANVSTVVTGPASNVRSAVARLIRSAVG